jgi:2-dehydro-3-deoxyphosphogluconate aldolase/(4S)-4-hydroxy-2-oxoglutarate aldolase
MTEALRAATVDALIDAGVIAVIRLPSRAGAMLAVEAIAAGGVRAVEITVTTPGAISLISELAGRPELLVGVGSVLDVETAELAIAAGARYVVSPVFDAEVLRVAQQAGVAVLPGAFTPTEILRAHESGADLVKVFPSDALGPGFIKAVLGPMPFLQLCPTGGVTPQNIGTWLAAGAKAVGLGGALVDAATVEAGDRATLTARASACVSAVHDARRSRSKEQS